MSFTLIRRSRVLSNWMRLMHSALAMIVMALASVALAEEPGPVMRVRQFVPITMSESGRAFAASKANRVVVLADRYEYFADEVNGQFLVCFLGHVGPEDADKRSIHLTLRQDGKEIQSLTVTPVSSPKLAVLIRTLSLERGQYELHAALKDMAGATLQQAARSFVRSDKTEPGVAFPANGIAIHVHPQSWVADAAWPISTGVPMPKMTIRDVSELSLLENGKPVAAQIVPRATWSPEGYIKWVGLDFTAKYDGYTPRSYRLVRRPVEAAASRVVLKAQQDDDWITLDTGVARFAISRKAFAGIEQAWVDHNGDGTFDDTELMISGKGGSYVVDDSGVRFDSWRSGSEPAEVTLEDVGPLRATVAAKGWYHDEKGTPLCKYVIRITVHAGQSFASISHRTINTIYDRTVRQFLRNVAFEVAPAGSVDRLRFGVDGDENAPALKHAGGEVESVFLHQDRSDRLRVVADDKQIAAGRRSDGWMTADTTSGSVTVFVRDFWQRFPNELELRRSGAASRLITHFWPAHGHTAFTDEEELARDQIYKVRWAHQGETLDLRIPDRYHDVLAEINKKENWAGGAELMIVDSKNNLSKMQVSSGQGTVIGNDLIVWLHPSAGGARRQAATTTIAAQTLLMQNAPHAIADPQWNCETQVLGPVAARDPEKFPSAERLMDTAYNFYRKGIIDRGAEYGRWIYGAVHSSWDPRVNAADMTRVWQMCHYQNVFQAWLLYFRSGLSDHLEWARIHSNQHLDVGVNNYTAYPPGSHSYVHLGDIGGAMYHCKGFMPWAGNSSTAGHWIDIANYYARYYLTGDRRGVDIGELWMSTLNKMSTSNANIVPADCDGFQTPAAQAKVNAYLKENKDLKPADYPQWIKDEFAKPRQFNPREVFVPLGELTQFYQATWDPQAIIYLDSYAEYLNPPFECTNSPSLSHFGKHWQDWYYALSRDRRVIDRIREFMLSQSQTDRSPRYDSFAAFLYHTTGEDRWLKPLVAGIHGQTLNVYDYPSDSLHQYSLAHSNPASMLLGRLPLFLHAIDKAGLTFAPTDDDPTVVPFRSGRVDPADKWLVPPRGWSNTGYTILAYAAQPTKIAVSVDGPKGFGNFRGFYMLFNAWPEIGNIPLNSDRKAAYARQQANIVTFSGTNLFNDPPTHRNFGVGRPENPQKFPYVEVADNNSDDRFYRLEVGGDPMNLPAIVEAGSEKPLPQVLVIARTIFQNNQVIPRPFHSRGALRGYVRPIRDDTVVNLVIESTPDRYWMPTTVSIVDGKGATVADTSVFLAGERKRVEVTLDPTRNPLPWKFTIASSGDNAFTFTGVEELLFARSPVDLDTILPMLRERVTE